MRHYRDQNVQIAYETLGPNTGPAVIWAHGWGQDHKAFLPLAKSLEKSAQHLLVDLPGFGETPMPESAWGTAEYADAMAGFIRHIRKGPVIWVGHSFGCRVGVQLAAKHPELVAGLFLIAAAGLQRKRPIHKKIYLKGRIALFKAMKKLVPHGIISEEKLYALFGSPDYRNAGPLRRIFVKTVNEDLTATAKRVKVPVALAYGTGDTETPLEMGKRFQKLIKGSSLMSFEGLDHYTILAEGRHQVAPWLKRFIEEHARQDGRTDV